MYFSINLLGLSLGISAFLYLMLYAYYEEHFEDFHNQKSNIYNVVMSRYKGGDLDSKHTASPHPVGKTIKNDVSGVKYATRFSGHIAKGDYVKNDSISGGEDRIYYADQDFFNMFSVEVSRGKLDDFLKAPYSVVLTEKIAIKYFGTTDVIGKQLHLYTHMNNRKFTVTGVVKELPENTIVSFDLLCSFESAFNNAKWFRNKWDWWGFPIFISLEEGVSMSDIESQFPAYIKKYKPDDIDVNYDWRFSLMPLKDIHLKSSFQNKAINPDKQAERIVALKFIAVLIILISWLNYINLSTASIVERAKEIGIRKAIGSSKSQLFWQFIVEIFLLNLLAFFVAILILYVLLPSLNISKGIGSVTYLQNYVLFSLYSSAILFFGVLFSGIYPAFTLVSLDPIKVLKTKNATSKLNASLRKVLVGVQFSISMLLITSTVIMMHQNHSMLNRKLGVDVSNKLTIARPKFAFKWKERFIATENLKNSLSEIENVKSVTTSSGIPSRVRVLMAVWRQEQGLENQKLFACNGIDVDYIPSFKIQILAGTNFTSDEKNNAHQVILTRKAVERLGYKSINEAIGKKVGAESFKDKPFTIIGVVEDYVYSSLKQESHGMILFKRVGLFSPVNYYTLDMETTAEISAVANEAQKRYLHLFPDDVYESFFIDDEVKSQYEEDRKQVNTFKIFALIAIVLAIVGIIGLASFIAQLKIREVSIRKVLGASSKDISWLLSKEFLLVIMISILVVIPLAYYLMQQWLLDYPYRITIQPWHFFISIVLVMVITGTVVIFNLIKVVRVVPSKTLKANE